MRKGEKVRFAYTTKHAQCGKCFVWRLYMHLVDLYFVGNNFIVV